MDTDPQVRKKVIEIMKKTKEEYKKLVDNCMSEIEKILKKIDEIEPNVGREFNKILNDHYNSLSKREKKELVTNEKLIIKYLVKEDDHISGSKLSDSLGLIGELKRCNTKLPKKLEIQEINTLVLKPYLKKFKETLDKKEQVQGGNEKTLDEPAQGNEETLDKKEPVQGSAITPTLGALATIAALLEAGATTEIGVLGGVFASSVATGGLVIAGGMVLVGALAAVAYYKQHGGDGTNQDDFIKNFDDLIEKEKDRIEEIIKDEYPDKHKQLMERKRKGTLHGEMVPLNTNPNEATLNYLRNRLHNKTVGGKRRTRKGKKSNKHSAKKAKKTAKRKARKARKSRR